MTSAAPVASRTAKRKAVAAIVPAAGSGSRLGLRTRKPFVKLAGKPLIIHTLEAVSASGSVDAIIVASHPACIRRIEGLVRRYRLNKVASVVAGGRTRAESVRNCLACLGEAFDIVLIHDGARPFVDRKTVDGVVASARRYGACIAAVPESDTVKLAAKSLFVKKTLNRNDIFRAQTPQAFKYRILKKAYEANFSPRATDDSNLVEMLGEKVKIFRGSYRNIKITTREDLLVAERVLKPGTAR